MESVKINAFEIENVKRIKAVAMTPAATGMTIIGGNNNQGKTSVLDTIAWALGGDRYRPSNPEREGSVIPPRIKLTLSIGLVVERSGKNSTLKVTDPNGQKSGQQLLNSFVEELALNLPKFMAYNNREKADVLLQIIGIKDQLYKMEQEEKELYNQRRAIGQIGDQKAKYARELPFYADVPSEPVSVSELIQRQQHILAVNGENQRKRQNAAVLEERRNMLSREIERMKAELAKAEAEYCTISADLSMAMLTVKELQDESTAQIEADIANIERINIKVRANLDRERAEQEAGEYQKQYAELTERLNAARSSRYELLQSAQLPLQGLSVEDGELTYKGKKWDSMSGSEQLRVSTAIVRALNPQCGFVLLDKLEQMDLNTLREFGAWLEEQGLQAIATRVSTGGECSIIIEDGMPVGESLPPVTPQKAWKAGVF